MTEEKFLHQIHLEEQFGSSTKLDAAKEKKKSANNAAIGYNYETEEPIPEPAKSADVVISEEKGEDEDSDIDLGIQALIDLYNAIFNIQNYKEMRGQIAILLLFRHMCGFISNRTVSSARNESSGSKIWTFRC